MVCTSSICFTHTARASIALSTTNRSHKMKFKELEKIIQEYESDTFSASAFEINEDEIECLAEKCIDWFVANRLDGVLLDFWLAEKRED